MRSTLNRFFELVDRVGLSACQCESWDEEKIEKILAAGIEWIKGLLKQQVLVLVYEWGSPETQTSWTNLGTKLDSLLNTKNLFSCERTRLYEGKPAQYEIFTGGFEYVPVIGLFPFYLFGERLSAWSIFEFAKLTSSVLAMNDHTRERLKLEGFSVPEDRQDRRWSVERTEFPHIMAAAGRGNIPFHYIGAGHAAVSLTQRISTLSDYWRLRASIKQVPANQESFPHGDPNIPALRSLLQQPAENENSEGVKPAIVISDLGDPTLNGYLKECRLNRPNLVTITGLEVPVGIGFSLAAVPQLLASRRGVEKVLSTLRDWVDDEKVSQSQSSRACTRERLLSDDGIAIVTPDKVISPWTRSSTT